MTPTTQLSLYKNALDNKGQSRTFEQILPLFTVDVLRDTTLAYRTMQAGKAKDDYKKKNFPAVTWSGTFTKRLASALKQHSGLICIDIDHLTKDQHDGFKKLLKNDPLIFFLFTSPSGTGLKIIFKISNDASQHLAYFLSIANYLKTAYSLVADPSGKDVSRLCFICYDNHFYHNVDCNVFPLDQWAVKDAGIKEHVYQADKKELSKEEEKEFTSTDTLDDILKFTENKATYVEGSRNAFLNMFAWNCNLKGIPKEDCYNYALTFTTDLPETEVRATITSVYNTQSHTHGKYQKGRKKANNLPANNAAKTQGGNTEGLPPTVGTRFNGNGASGMGVTNTGNGKNDLQPQPNHNGASQPQAPTVNGQQASGNQYSTDDELFWYTALNEKTNKETISLVYGKFFDFLETQGFCNLKIDTQNVELIRLAEGVVEPAIINNNRNDVKTYINTFCKQHQLYKVLEMLHRGEDKYFARKKFINLNYKKIEFLTDTQDTSFYFHSNSVVEVTKHGITTRPYREGEKALWRSQIIDKPFTPVKLDFPVDDSGRYIAKEFKGEWARFQCLASSSPNKTIDAETANKRFYSHATAFGYLINGFKPSDGKAIVAVDHQKGTDRSQQNGRTGKGLFAKALGYVKKRYNVDGRKFDPKDNTVFDAVTMDVKVITVTDCHPRLDFGYFFVPITEDFTYRKLYLGYVTIPFALSPKWYFDTNFSFMGDGASFEGRQHIIEFDNYFTPAFRPIHEFGHSLFIDWNDEQWNLFYNYCYWCDQLYKTHGLIDYPSGNYLDRKLMNECPQEFVDWLDAIELDAANKPKQIQGKPIHIIARNSRHQKLAIYGQWKTQAEQWGMIKTSAKQFTSWMQKYCAVRNLQYVTDKKGGVEYAWICDASVDPEKIKLIGELQFQSTQ